MTKILITGHKGLIGKALFDRLCDKNDVFGYDLGDSLVDTKYDIIIHAAANCVIRDTISNPGLSMDNIITTFQVFEIAKNYDSKIIAFSSGRVSHDVYNPYTVSKRFLENMAKAYKSCYDLDCLVIRPETVWGDSLNHNRAVIRWTEAALKDEPLYIFGPKDKELPPIYIDEFTDIVMDLITDFSKHKNKTLKVSGQIRKAFDIASAIVKQTKSKSKIIFQDEEKTQPQVCKPSDFTSSVAFEDSFKKFLEQYYERS